MTVSALDKLPELLAQMGLQVRPLGRMTVQDDYLDTPDWRFFASGHALRLRQQADKAIFTLKALKPVEDGVAMREEHEQVLEALNGVVMQIPHDVLDGRVNEISAGGRMNFLFKVEQERTVFEVTSESGFQAEVSADHARYRVVSGARQEFGDTVGP